MSPFGPRAAHLVRRFAGSVHVAPISADERTWALAQLTPAETELWLRQGPADRRHTVTVAEGLAGRLGLAGPGDGSETLDAPDRAVLAAALLHDIGKLDAGLGVAGRVAATLWSSLVGARATSGRGRMARYLRHEPIGAAWLAERGSHPITIALVAGAPTAPSDVLAALRAEDDAC